MFPWCLGMIISWFCYAASILIFVTFSCAKKKKRIIVDKSENTADYEWIYLQPANTTMEKSKSDDKGQTGTDTLFKKTQLLHPRIGSGDQGVQVHSDEPRGSQQHKPTLTPTPTPEPKPKSPEKAIKQPGKKTTYGLLFEEEGQKDFREIVLCNNRTPIRKNVKKPAKLQEIQTYVCPAKTVYGFPIEETNPKLQRHENKVIDQHLQMNRTHPPRNPRKAKQAAPLDSPPAHLKKKLHPQDVYGMKSHSDRDKPIAAAGSDVFGMMEDSLRRPIERPKKKRKN